MKKDLSIPAHIDPLTSFKRRYGLRDLYRAYWRVPSAVALLAKNKRQDLVDEQFIERVQLAVTEVSGCAVCSYAHTQMALNMGMSNEEISSFLSGESTFIAPAEAKAIAFGQHFAETGGYPERSAYEAIVAEYGADRAAILLAGMQVMIVGNMIGLPMSALQARRKGRPYRDSSLWYELGMIVLGTMLLPIGVLHGVLRGWLGLPAQTWG